MLSDAPYYQRKCLWLCRLTGGQTPLGSCPPQAAGLVFSASCGFVLSAPKAPGCHFSLVLMGSVAGPAPREGEQQVWCFGTFCYGSNGPHTLLLFLSRNVFHVISRGTL